MIRIAIVEDDTSYATVLKTYLDRFAEEKHYNIECILFTNGINFITNYTASWDIVLMDIDMPYMNGMETAKRMRKLDPVCCLIFVTNLTQYAIEGYECNAYDYILKPVRYESFAFRISRAIALVEKKQTDYVFVKKKTGNMRIAVADIYYVESRKHKICYHTFDGEIEEYGNLNYIEQTLRKFGFARCGVSFLVNLAYVTEESDDHIKINEEFLKMTRSYKHSFKEALTLFLTPGSGICRK